MTYSAEFLPREWDYAVHSTGHLHRGKIECRGQFCLGPLPLGSRSANFSSNLFVSEYRHALDRSSDRP